MREIFFRGKRTDNGEWIDGYFVQLFDSEDHISNRIYSGYSDFYPDWDEVDPETVGQYTELCDKNGKRMFEGDVITGLFLYAIPVNGVCVFKDGAFGLEWDRGGTKEFSAFTSICNVEYEIIGNIHDNPELLGGDGE